MIYIILLNILFICLIFYISNKLLNKKENTSIQNNKDNYSYDKEDTNYYTKIYHIKNRKIINDNFLKLYEDNDKKSDMTVLNHEIKNYLENVIDNLYETFMYMNLDNPSDIHKSMVIKYKNELEPIIDERLKQYTEKYNNEIENIANDNIALLKEKLDNNSEIKRYNILENKVISCDDIELKLLYKSLDKQIIQPYLTLNLSETEKSIYKDQILDCVDIIEKRLSDDKKYINDDSIQNLIEFNKFYLMEIKKHV